MQTTVALDVTVIYNFLIHAPPSLVNVFEIYLETFLCDKPMCKYFSDHTDHGKQNNFDREVFQLYLKYSCVTFLPVYTYMYM